MNLEKEIFDISLNDIIPNRFQPREIFSDVELKELSESIKEHGVIQPIIVRKVGDKYEIIAGERRFRASRMAGKETIPALIRDIDDKEAAKMALLENLQRSNLTPIEEAKTYQTILKIDNITQEELANSLGKSQSAIANKLRLLTLSEEVQTALLNSQISERHARSLLSVSPSQQNDLLKRIIKEKLTVRQLDEQILKLIGKAPHLETEEEQETAIPQIIAEKQPLLEEQQISNNIEKPNTSNETENSPSTEEKSRPLNIFDKLRISNDSQEKNASTPEITPIEETKPTTTDNQIYDMRFAINNFRQAIQNTEKFGFKVKSTEYDAPTKYQIVIEIEK